jgi:uncharacterized protein (DUF433 family)
LGGCWGERAGRGGPLLSTGESAYNNVVTTAQTYPHVEKTGAEPARLARVPRVRVSQVVADYIAHGWSPEEMCRQHPYLTLAEAHTAMAYYFDHQEEIDRELEAELKTSEKEREGAPPSKFLLRMRALGRL